METVEGEASEALEHDGVGIVRCCVRRRRSRSTWLLLRPPAVHFAGATVGLAVVLCWSWQRKLPQPLIRVHALLVWLC